MYSKTFWIGLAERSLWTFVQAFVGVFVALVGAGGVTSFADVDWALILQSGLIAGLVAVAKGFVNSDTTDTAVAQYHE